jgi:hypothetical protein
LTLLIFRRGLSPVTLRAVTYAREARLEQVLRSGLFPSIPTECLSPLVRTGSRVRGGDRLAHLSANPSSYSSASISMSRIGGSAGRHESVIGPVVVGAGSFPRSFLIPGTGPRSTSAAPMCAGPTLAPPRALSFRQPLAGTAPFFGLSACEPSPFTTIYWDLRDFTLAAAWSELNKSLGEFPFKAPTGITQRSSLSLP